MSGENRAAESRTYIAIDLKSFYASVECMDRGLDPLTTNLVVADESRTEKTICLAVSPSLKAYGISGRARLFEVVQRVRESNAARTAAAPGRRLTEPSWDDEKVRSDPGVALGYITAVPRMARYMEKSAQVYQVYLKYVAPEDIHVYSIDEVFMDVTNYLSARRMTAREMASAMILDVLKETGITATAGIGTNLYLCKVAMDIGAKHVREDENGVRIACLDEMSYRRQLWSHRPLRDFWRVGRGTAARLESAGIFTMGDIARVSLENEDILYKMFGVNAELLIDHAWGYEPCSMQEVKAYQPESSSFSSGQVLQEPYSAEKARVVAWEMADAIALNLVEKGLMADQLVLTVGYDRTNLEDPERRRRYKGPVTTDYYGRRVPKHAQGTANLKRHTSSSKQIVEALLDIFDKIVDFDLLVRRISIATNHVITEAQAKERQRQEDSAPVQLDLFTDYAALEREKQKEEETLEKERRLQEAMLSIKHKFGSNAVLKGTNFREGATGRDRNAQIGGHKA
ncbi:MAG: DNA methylase [Lachnospiraceae bacterium]|nr:DNA methylase [Lachnospiraceae bacterium]